MVVRMNDEGECYRSGIRYRQLDKFGNFKSEEIVKYFGPHSTQVPGKAMATAFINFSNNESYYNKKPTIFVLERWTEVSETWTRV
jgi:hypothetical protein